MCTGPHLCEAAAPLRYFLFYYKPPPPSLSYRVMTEILGPIYAMEAQSNDLNNPVLLHWPTPVAWQSSFGGLLVKWLVTEVAGFSFFFFFTPASVSIMPATHPYDDDVHKPRRRFTLKAHSYYGGTQLAPSDKKWWSVSIGHSIPIPNMYTFKNLRGDKTSQELHTRKQFRRNTYYFSTYTVRNILYLKLSAWNLNWYQRGDCLSVMKLKMKLHKKDT